MTICPIRLSPINSLNSVPFSEVSHSVDMMSDPPSAFIRLKRFIIQLFVQMECDLNVAVKNTIVGIISTQAQKPIFNDIGFSNQLDYWVAEPYSQVPYNPNFKSKVNYSNKRMDIGFSNQLYYKVAEPAFKNDSLDNYTVNFKSNSDNSAV